jgi:hypothetical protein
MRTLIVLALAAVVAACSSSAAASPSPAPTNPPSPSPAAVLYPIDTSAASLVLRIDTAGGFMATGAALARVPDFSLYGDGRVIVPGGQIAIYPSPLLPAVAEAHLTAAEVQRLLAAADAAGLLGPDGSYGGPGMPDAGQTVFTLTVAGKTHVISATTAMAGASADPADPTTRIAAFRASLGDLSALLGRTVTETMYEAPGYRVFLSAAGPVDATASSASVVDWPLATDPAKAGPTAADGITCMAVTGTDTATFAKAATTANATTIWRASSGNYLAQVRPLLPNEQHC